MKKINIFDFDGTLFNSPIPNPKLWDKKFFGRLQNPYKSKGFGWFYNPLTLSKVDYSQFNKDIVKLVIRSYKDKDALTVLLTGRNVSNTGAVEDILAVGALKSKFDFIILKPKGSHSTSEFKERYIDDLMAKYNPEVVNIYDDRESQIKKFKNYALEKASDGYNVNVFPVSYPVYHMSEEDEIAIVRELILDERIDRNEPIEIDLEENGPKNYVAILDKETSEYLNASFLEIIPRNWIPNVRHHMTICSGIKSQEELKFIVAEYGKSHKMKAVALGISEDAIALKVETDIPSKNEIKHITLATPIGGKSYLSNKIETWYELDTPFDITGKITRVIYA